MFGKDVELTVRLPKAGEQSVSPRLSTPPSSPAAVPASQKEIEKPEPKKPEPIEKPAPIQTDETDENEEELIDETEEKETSLSSYNAHSKEYYMHSDTVNMALEVFGGKIIE